MGQNSRAFDSAVILPLQSQETQLKSGFGAEQGFSEPCPRFATRFRNPLGLNSGAELGGVMWSRGRPARGLPPSTRFRCVRIHVQVPRQRVPVPALAGLHGRLTWGYPPAPPRVGRVKTRTQERSLSAQTRM